MKGLCTSKYEQENKRNKDRIYLNNKLLVIIHQVNHFNIHQYPFNIN
jgi:hypothetical protein